MWYDFDADRPLMNTVYLEPQIKYSYQTRKSRTTCRLPMWTISFGIIPPLRITALKIMKTKTEPDSDLHDEPEGEDVSKAFIGGCGEGPVPLMEWTSKEIVLLETEDFVNMDFLLVFSPANLS